MSAPLDKRGREGGKKKQVQREGQKEPLVLEPLSRCLVLGRGMCSGVCTKNEQEPCKREGQTPAGEMF